MPVSITDFMDDRLPAVMVTATPSPPNAPASPTRANGQGGYAQAGQISPGRSILLRPNLALKKQQRPHSAHECVLSNGIKDPAAASSNLSNNPPTHTPIHRSSMPRPRSQTLSFYPRPNRSSPPAPPKLSRHLSLSADVLGGEQTQQRAEKDSASERRLANFVAQHSKQFPLRVKVCKGFCGNSSEVSISQGEVFDFHFLKHSKVVTLRVSHGIEYSVPLSSVIRFGVVYDPYGNEKMALKGFQFRMANEIMGLKSLPILICATRAYQAGSHEGSVAKGEVMVVRGIKSSIHGRMLKVFSLKHGKKYLSEKCEAYFSTRPSNVSMHLHEMFHNSIPFPQKAMLYPTAEVSHVLPPHLLTSPVTLKQCKVQTSVVATCPALHAGQEGGFGGAVDIPVDLDTEVEACNLPPSECAKQQQITRSVYKNFDPVQLCSYFDTPTSESYEIQCALFTSIQTDLKLFGIQLVKPDLLFEGHTLSLECLHIERMDSPMSLDDRWSQFGSSQCSSPASNDFSTNLSEIFMSEAIESKQYLQLDERVIQLSKQVADLTAKVDRLATVVERSSQFTQGLDSIEVTDSLMSWCSKIQGEVSQLQADVKTIRKE